MAIEDHNTTEFADAGEEEVAALLSSLTRVDPPGDFDMRVCARIAQRKPATSRPSWFPSLARIAAPTALLAIAGGYFGYHAFYREGNVNVPAVAESRPAVVSPAAAQPTAEAVEPQASTPEVAAAKPSLSTSETGTASPKKSPAVNKPVQPTDGSVDIALREANARSLRESNGNTGPARSTLSVRDVFSAMGIRATHSGTGWRVSSVSGAAAAAGLREGDIIESINGVPVGVSSTFDAEFRGRSLRVRRDGAVVTISL